MLRKGKYLITIIILNLLKIFWIFPLKRNTFLFISFGGLQYSDSPLYIEREIHRRIPDCSIIWIFRKKIENIPDYIKYYRQGSILALKAFATSKYIITNDSLKSYLPVRKSQICINTWHGGGAFKTVGLAENKLDPYTSFFLKIQNKKITAFISSSEYFTEGVIRSSFKYYGKVLPYGLPRNAILFQSRDDIKEKVYKYFKIDRNPGNGIVLYAPTYRGKKGKAGFITEYESININFVLESLSKRFNKKFYFLFRAHHAMNNGEFKGNILYATEYHDIQELLYTADVLISDYSSCILDMSLTKKPVFLYTPDIEEYENERGMDWNLRESPYPLGKTNEELCQKILDFDETYYSLNVDKYLEKLGSFDGSDSLTKTVDWILGERES